MTSPLPLRDARAIEVDYKCTNFLPDSHTEVENFTIARVSAELFSRLIPEFLVAAGLILMLLGWGLDEVAVRIGNGLVTLGLTLLALGVALIIRGEWLEGRRLRKTGSLGPHKPGFMSHGQGATRRNRSVAESPEQDT